MARQDPQKPEALWLPSSAFPSLLLQLLSSIPYFSGIWECTEVAVIRGAGGKLIFQLPRKTIILICSAFSASTPRVEIH